MEIPFIKLYVWFAENNNAALLCQQLRGGQLFRAMQENPGLLPLKGEVIIPEDGRALAPAKHSEGQVVFADLAVLVENPRMYDRAIDTGVTFIVDLHFPLPVPEKMAALQPGRTDEDRDVLLDQEAREYWSKPERVSLAWEILRNADLVTVPHRDWLQMLVGTGVNGVLLPDVEDGNLDSAVGFHKRFWTAAYSAMPRFKGIRGWFGQAALQTTLWLKTADLKRQLMSDIEWDANSRYWGDS
jgi:hypothetical protein